MIYCYIGHKDKKTLDRVMSYKGITYEDIAKKMKKPLLYIYKIINDEQICSFDDAMKILDIICEGKETKYEKK